MFDDPPLALPRSTDVPPMPGVVKARAEDFRVEELPEREPSGSGEHLWLEVEKRGLSTDRAMRAIARALDVPPRQVGYAGLKDARAVTVQWLSFGGASSARAEALDLPRLRIRSIARSDRKLRVGALLGNRFEVTLRDVEPERLADARAVLEALAIQGMPNYFGEQRFGTRGDTAHIGRALLREQWRAALDLMAAAPSASDRGSVLQARELAAAGEWRKAARAFPGAYSETAAVCRAMARTGDAAEALAQLSRRTTQFYVSACQGEVFNALVADRVRHLERVIDGDYVLEHSSGRVFEPEAVDEALAARARAFELSATVPLFGKRVRLSGGDAGRREADALASCKLAADRFAALVAGDRRPARVRPVDVAIEEIAGNDEAAKTDEVATAASAAPPAWRVRFSLPPGAYATVLLREFLQAPNPAGDASRGALIEGGHHGT